MAIVENLAQARVRVELVYGPKSEPGRAALACSSAMANAIGILHYATRSEQGVDDEKLEEWFEAASTEQANGSTEWKRFIAQAHADARPSGDVSVG